MKTYCVTCRKKTNNLNVKVVKKDGHRRMKSTCTDCHNKKSTFIGETCPL